jgi:hypothetical protein
LFDLGFAVIAHAVLFGSRSFYLSMYFVIVDLYLLFDLGFVVIAHAVLLGSRDFDLSMNFVLLWID